MKLSQEQYRQFDDEGYVIVEQGLSDTDFNPLIQEIEAFVDRRAVDLYDRNLISDRYEHALFDRRLALITRENTTIYDDIDIMHFRGEALFDFLGNNRLMDIVEGLVGPEILCSPIQHLRAKLPGNLTASDDEQSVLSARINENVAPWHQDAQVHLEEADPVFILTVWIPLCDTDEENGCLQIIPGVHKKNMVYWSEGFGIKADALPGDEVLSLPMQKGDVLLMHKLIPHRSIPNHADTIRWSMDLRYQKVGTPTGRSFYPDFITRSRACPAAALSDYGVWRRAWEDALAATPRRPGRKNRPVEPMSIDMETGR